MLNRSRILMAMSGGVDSSVSASVLVEQGHEVIGVFMKNWEDCDWRADQRDANRVAAQLGIPFHTVDFVKEYRQSIYEYMLDEYTAGRTPNPDVLCNQYMKFGFLLQEADRLGCEYIATGHYAQTTLRDGSCVHLLAGVDTNKDQSYFLCRLDQEQLKRALFPIGHLTKNEVRKIARERDLVVAEKKDSQGICFIGKVELSEFLKQRIEEREGNIVTTDGEVIGTHQGHMFYTIGQRHGLGIGGGKPYFVVERRPQTNEIVVGFEDDPALFKTDLVAVELTETYPGALRAYEGKRIRARIRYRQSLEECVFHFDTDRAIFVSFTHPQRAVAPGQFLAIYNGNELIGSGVIVE